MTTVHQDYETCRRITETRGPNFSLGFRFLPLAKRRAVHAAYAFCRLVDDLVDEGTTKSKAHHALELWEEELHKVYEGIPSRSVGRALCDSLCEFPLPKEAFLKLIQGCRDDLEGRRYRTYEDLVGYCELVATTIGRISLSIFGVVNNQAHECGRNLSIALQLTNILRDIREDAQRDRVYLPLDDLEQNGVSMESLMAGEVTPGLLTVLETMHARAQSLYAQAQPLVGYVQDDARVAVCLMGGVYEAILQRLAADPRQALRQRVGLSDAEKRKLPSIIPSRWIPAGVSLHQMEAGGQ